MTHLLLALVIGTPSAPPAIKVHVDGEGYLRFACGSQAVYAADALLTTSQGVLATPEGYPLLPQIHVPRDSRDLKIDLDGMVTAGGKRAGRIVLARFGSARLQKSGAYYVASTQSSIGLPGEGIFGVIRASSEGAGKAAAKPQTSPQQPANDSPVAIAVSLRSDVDGPDILLGDVATIDAPAERKERLKSFSLGAAPMIGAQRGLTRSYIVAKLKSEGIDTDAMTIECPFGATVARKSQKVGEDAILQAAVAGVKSKLGLDDAMRLDRSIDDILVPAGALSIGVKEAVLSPDGATANVEIKVDDKVVARRTVNLVETNPAPMIRVNDPVKICFIKNGATVQMPGKARSSGRVGTTITVEAESGPIFTGILRSTTIVEVKL